MVGLVVDTVIQEKRVYTEIENGLSMEDLPENCCTNCWGLNEKRLDPWARVDSSVPVKVWVKKRAHIQNWPFVKNPHFSFYLYETW